VRGERPHLLVTTTLDALQDKVGSKLGTINGGCFISPGAAAASPATQTSSRSYSAPTANHSTSAAPPASSRSRCAAPSSPATKDARSPAATDPPAGATPTTAPTGPTAAQPHYATWLVRNTSSCADGRLPVMPKVGRSRSLRFGQRSGLSRSWARRTKASCDAAKGLTLGVRGREYP